MLHVRVISSLNSFPLAVHCITIANSPTAIEPNTTYQHLKPYAAMMNHAPARLFSPNLDPVGLS